MLYKKTTILLCLAICLHGIEAVQGGGCCFSRPKEEEAGFVLQPPRPLYRISSPRLTSSTNDFARASIVAAPYVTAPTPPSPSVVEPPQVVDTLNPPSPSVVEPPQVVDTLNPPSSTSRSHLSARPMPFRGNTDFDTYKEEMRRKGIQHIIPRTPSDTNSRRSLSSRREGEHDAQKWYTPPPIASNSYFDLPVQTGGAAEATGRTKKKRTETSND